MVGVALAALAGIGFGFFQLTNSRAGRGVDTYVGTFVVLAVSVTVLAAITATTQDLAAMGRAPLQAYGWFALAGGVHFFFGWTFLTLSQRRLGASRTGVLTGTTPLFGTLIAFVVLGEAVRSLAIVGIVMVVAGTIWLARSRAAPQEDAIAPPAWTVVLGLAAAVCWGTSPVFIRWGLDGLDAPMIGVTVGLLAATLAYGLALAVRGGSGNRMQRSAAGWLVVAGTFVAAAIAAQWAALSQAPVAVVLALSQLAVPVVVIVAPLVSSESVERLRLSGKLAAAVIVGGSLVIIVARSGAA